jgi:hypothetical protein
MKDYGISGIILLAVSLFGCKPMEIFLHGDITGTVTDAETSLPIQASLVRLNAADSITTGDDGSIQFRNLTPGQYEIQASKATYAESIYPRFFGSSGLCL